MKFKLMPILIAFSFLLIVFSCKTENKPAQQTEDILSFDANMVFLYYQDMEKANDFYMEF